MLLWPWFSASQFEQRFIYSFYFTVINCSNGITEAFWPKILMFKKRAPRAPEASIPKFVQNQFLRKEKEASAAFLTISLKKNQNWAWLFRGVFFPRGAFKSAAVSGSRPCKLLYLARILHFGFTILSSLLPKKAVFACWGKTPDHRTGPSWCQLQKQVRLAFGNPFLLDFC